MKKRKKLIKYFNQRGAASYTALINNNMTEMIAIPQPQYVEMVNFIQNCIRNKFDATDNNEWWTQMHLIEQAKELGCTEEFIAQMRKDVNL